MKKKLQKWVKAWNEWNELFESHTKAFFLILVSVALFLAYFILTQLEEMVLIMAGFYEPVEKPAYLEEPSGYYTATEYFFNRQLNALIVLFVLACIFVFIYLYVRTYTRTLQTTAKSWLELQRCFDTDRAIQLFLEGKKEAFKIAYRSASYTGKIRKFYDLRKKPKGVPQRCFASLLDAIGYDAEKEMDK